MPLVILQTVSRRRKEACQLYSPFLSSIQDIIFAIGALGRSRGNVRDIATSLRLCDGDTGTLLASEEVGEESLLQILATELDNGRNTERETGVEGASGAAKTRAGQLCVRVPVSIDAMNSRLHMPTYLITVDAGVNVVPIFHLDTQDIIDSKTLTPFHGKGSRHVGQQHVGLAECLEHMLRYSTCLLPLHRMLDQVFPGKLATCLLESTVGVCDVRGRESAQVWRLREGNGVGRVIGHRE